MTYMAVRVAGYEVTEDDLEELRANLASLPNVRVSGAWESAAAPPAVVAMFIGFFGAKLVEFLMSKGFDEVWERIGDAWKGYRESRARRDRKAPIFERMVLQTADCEVAVNAVIEPGSPELAKVLHLLGERLTTGLLANQSIERITLPCRLLPDGMWETVRFPEEGEDVDFYVWHLKSRDVNGYFGYYDAREDAWIDQVFR